MTLSLSRDQVLARACVMVSKAFPGLCGTEILLFTLVGHLIIRIGYALLSQRHLILEPVTMVAKFLKKTLTTSFDLTFFRASTSSSIWVQERLGTYKSWTRTQKLTTFHHFYSTTWWNRCFILIFKACKIPASKCTTLNMSITISCKIESLCMDYFMKRLQQEEKLPGPN